MRNILFASAVTATCAILPERLATTDPYKQITEVVGSGPVRFNADEWVQGSRFVYQSLEGYKPCEGDEPNWTWGPKVVYFERGERHVISDPASPRTQRWRCCTTASGGSRTGGLAGIARRGPRRSGRGAPSGAGSLISGLAGEPRNNTPDLLDELVSEP